MVRGGPRIKIAERRISNHGQIDERVPKIDQKRLAGEALYLWHFP